VGRGAPCATVARIVTDFDRQARSTEWEDLDLPALELLARDSAERGWRAALADVAPRRPFFVKRLENLSLGNWHLLLALSNDRVALDVGCGFGSLALGLGKHFNTAIGVDALWSRISYAALRAKQEGSKGNAFIRATGFDLPIRSGSVDLATMNGVLEWAGLYANGDPRVLQLALLREIKRTLASRGTLALAIENRFAMESLAGMPDTHTQMRLVPAVPRVVADIASRIRRKQPYRTYLYDAGGYHRLAGEAGFAQTRVYDLVSSYNDYDFIVKPGDSRSYALLWKRSLVRSFHNRAAKARRALARVLAGALGKFAYAYLIFAGVAVCTVLDDDHEFWRRAASHGVSAGVTRLACQGPSPGSLTIVAHDGETVMSVMTIQAIGRTDPSALHAAPRLTPIAEQLIKRRLALATSWDEGGLAVRLYT
jgi:ubiquinone/menaquinone biosynthesis C-methylase UbiE